ncbi:MAG: hypothetical protein HYZ51_02460 [Candidatus Doudnabacteria bacterium]|nr:hypothetical protein [Candidatus Doudnabacteria bacterium]
MSNGVKSKIKKFIILVVLALSILPQLSFAEVPGGQGNNNSGACVPDSNDKFCPGPDFCWINGVCLPAPKGNQSGAIGATTVFGLIKIAMTWLLTFAGIIATVFLIIGGYQYITAAGNEEQSEKAKKTIINSILGIVVVVLAITIVTIITNTLGQSNPLG